MTKDPKPPAKAMEAKSQVEKFRELAREIGASESEEPLNEALRKVAKVKRDKADKAKVKKPSKD